MSGFRSEALSAKHDRSGFTCGVAVLDEYLRTRAMQDMRRYSAAVFVLLQDAEPARIAGFYSLSAFSVELDSLPESAAKRLARYPVVPSILIGRLARSTAFPGLGATLLMDAITRCVRQSDEIGASLIVVDAKDEEARAFYEKHGFLGLISAPMRLVLPMKTAAVAVG
jgi:predicted GNAT family N-acyltransferase